MDSIEKTYLIAAPVGEVWRALTDPEVISEWSHAPAEYIAEPGAPYSLWNGDIRGEILEVVPEKRLVKTWRPANWTSSDSIVTFLLVPMGDSTRVDLLHENVEAFDRDDTDEGWDSYYLGVIKNMLESRAAAPGSGSKAAAKRGATKKSTGSKAAAKKGAAKTAAKKSASKKTTKKAATKRPAARKGAAKKNSSRKRPR